MRSLCGAVLIFIATISTSSAHTHHHHHHAKSNNLASKRTSAATIPSEKSRDPADVALDRKIKSICHGC
jgi:hypothetical protein